MPVVNHIKIREKASAPRSRGGFLNLFVAHILKPSPSASQGYQVDSHPCGVKDKAMIKESMSERERARVRISERERKRARERKNKRARVRE